MCWKSGLFLCGVLLIGLPPVIPSKTKKDRALVKDGEVDATAGELLLEMMVKIAAHPDQWNKVHQLLESINNSSILSDKTELQNVKPKKEANVITRSSSSLTDKKLTSENLNKPKESGRNAKSPHFQSWDNKFRIYPKTFAYHRVTGRPIFLDKNPKTYVAVSVIAPKHKNSEFKEDLSLERELTRLKPWTHEDNLKNMASIRSRWVIQKL